MTIKYSALTQRRVLPTLALLGCAGLLNADPAAYLRSEMVGFGLLGADGGHAQAQAGRVVRSFPLTTVTTVLLRAAEAETTSVVIEPGRNDIEVSGLPMGGAKGYHAPDPNWRETPASEWGLDFATAKFGEVLVISTTNEMRYIHHHYAFSSLVLRAPPNVKVMRESRRLTGDGKPDLQAPKPAPSEPR